MFQHFSLEHRFGLLIGILITLAISVPQALAAKANTNNATQQLSTLHQQARAYYEKGQYQQSAQLYENVLTLKKQLFGANSVEITTTLNSLGNAYRELNEYDKATTLYDQAITLITNKFDGNHPALGVSLNNLGYLNAIRGDAEQAMAYYQRALKVLDKQTDATYQKTTTDVWNNLGELYREHGQYEQARSYYFKTLAIDKQQAENNQLSIDMATTLGNIALSYSLNGDYSKALEYYRQSQQIISKTVGEDSWQYALVLHNLGIQYNEQQNYPKAQQFVEQALKLAEKFLPKDHVILENMRHNYQQIMSSASKPATP